MYYEIILKKTQAELEYAVHIQLERGWKCEGGVNVSYPYPGGVCFAQAMTHQGEKISL